MFSGIWYKLRSAALKWKIFILAAGLCIFGTVLIYGPDVRPRLMIWLRPDAEFYHCKIRWRISEKACSKTPSNNEFLPSTWSLLGEYDNAERYSNEWIWQSIGGYQFLSAHYDDRDDSVNVLMHSLGTGYPDYPTVTLFPDDGDDGVQVDPAFMYFSSRQTRRHLVQVKLCNPFESLVRSTEQPSTLPSHVVLSDKKGKTIALPVRYSLTAGKQMDFGVCVAPLHNPSFIPPQTIAAFVEMYRILGVSKFVFFNHSISKESEELLNIYVNDGLAEIIPWPLYNESEALVYHYKGQETPYATCLYRYMYKMKWMAIVDLDEFIIPRGNHMQTLNDVVSLGDSRTGLWGLTNNFFPVPLEINKQTSGNVSLAQRLGLAALLNAKRYPKKFPYKERSKYIVNPRRVTLLLTHEAWLVRGYENYIVKPEEAMLQHYRRMDSISDTETVEDSYFRKYYAQELTKNVARVLSRTNSSV